MVFESQAATCPPVYHTRRKLLTVFFIAERQAGKLLIPSFIVFGLTRPGIDPVFTISAVDGLSTDHLSCEIAFLNIEIAILNTLLK